MQNITGFAGRAFLLGGKMNKKTIILILFFSLFSFFANFLSYADAAIDISVSQAYASRYIWRGQDLFADNGAACQPEIDIVFPELAGGVGFGLNIWGSIPVSGGQQDAQEVDYTIAFSKDVGDLNLSLGFTYFNFPNTSLDSDVSEPWLAIDGPLPFLANLSFNVFAAYDFKVTSGGPDEGWYYSWGFGYSLPLDFLAVAREGQTLNFAVTNWGNDGVADLKSSLLYATELSFSTSYFLGEAALTPGFHYSINHESQINDGNDEIWGSITVSYLF